MGHPKWFRPGTVSHATLRSADLIPSFTAELRRIWEAGGGPENSTQVDRLQEIETLSKQGDSYFGSEASDWDLEWLFDRLNDLAPEGYYFGAHEGDGSDFGFWQGELA